VRAPPAVLGEVRRVADAFRNEQDTSPVGPMLVSGMLAEQLARLLGEHAAPGAVIASDSARVTGSSVLVRVIAGDPSSADEDVVRSAAGEGIPVVLVQLWPQAAWTKPFVLSPFVVECRAGEGFPVPEIAARIAEAVERPASLARRVPALEPKVARRVVAAASVRAAILAAVGTRAKPARPLITLEQVRMLGELSNLSDGERSGESIPSLAGLAASTVACGFVFRGAARNVRRVLPAPLVNAAVAGAGTWLLGEAFRRFGNRLP
jgi:hypothetical protein